MDDFKYFKYYICLFFSLRSEQGYITGERSSGQIGVKNLEVLRLTAPGRGGEHKEDAMSREWVNTLIKPKVLLGKIKNKDLDHTKSTGKENQTDRKEDEDRDEKKRARFQSSGDPSSSHASGRGATFVGRALDPSVIFSTITNTGEGMTCLHISKDVTQAVAGFRDSCLRVWRLDERDGSSTRGDRLLDGQWSMCDVLPTHAAPRDMSKGKVSQTPSSFISKNREDSGSRSKKNMMGGVLELYGHSKAIYGVSQGTDDNCRHILSCSADETIRLWNTSVSQCVGKYSCIGPSWGVSFSPLEYYFASANQVRIVLDISNVDLKIFFLNMQILNHFLFHFVSVYDCSSVQHRSIGTFTTLYWSH